MSFSSSGIGVVYAAFGRHNLEESVVSIASLRRHMPSIGVSVYTDDAGLAQELLAGLEVENIFPVAADRFPPENTLGSGQKFFALHKLQYPRTLFLDTDTVILGDLTPVFSLLDRFDIAARSCSPWWGQCTPGYLRDSNAPALFPEYNTGVLLLNAASERTVRFLATWRRLFEEYTRDPQMRSGDQQAFREAIWITDVQVFGLKENFNYWGQESEHMPVVIAHKILNKTPMFHPLAKPGDLIREHERVKTERLWTLLCEIDRGDAPESKFAELKNEERKRLSRLTKAHKLIDRVPNKSASALNSVAVPDLSSSPGDIDLIGKHLRDKYGPKKAPPPVASQDSLRVSITMQPITTLIVLSSAHEVLFRRYFQPSLPEGLRVLPMELGVNQSDGAYMSKEWQDAMCAKVRHALAFCHQAPEREPFIVSDVDVQFFPAFDSAQFLKYVDSLGCDLAFQRERFRDGDAEANCGFYTGRNTAAVRNLLISALENLEADSIRNEQNAVNRMLRKSGIPYALLDHRFYARTHGFPPPKDLWVHHASWTTTIPEKIRQLERVRRIAGGGGVRLHLESYAELLSRAFAQNRSLRSFVDVTREYLSKVPLRPGCLR